MPDTASLEPYRIRRTRYDPAVWGRILDGRLDREIFHTPAWLEYLRVTQQAEPVVAAVFDGEVRVGYLVGATVRRFGLRIFGSPLKGWGTDVMGFLLDEGANRQRAIAALPAFAYDGLGCVHVEIGDRFTVPSDFEDMGFIIRTGDSIVIDIAGSDDEILSNMRSRTRTYVRRAQRTGLRFEVAHDLAFADEYFDQLVDVFASQGLTPTYGVERVRALIEHIGPSGHLLMMRALDASGEPVATTLTVGMNDRAILLGLAHYRASRSLHAVEPLQFQTMRAWRARGVKLYDLAGAETAKAKFGETTETLIRAHHSRFAFLEAGRSFVRSGFYARQKALGRLAKRRPGNGGSATSVASWEAGSR